MPLRPPGCRFRPWCYAREDYQSKLGTFRDLTVPWIRRIFVVGLGMAVINQISGVNAIMYYGTSILSSSGFGAREPCSPTSSTASPQWWP